MNWLRASWVGLVVAAALWMAPAEGQARVVIRVGPPAPVVEVVGVAPFSGAVWVRGHYRHDGLGYRWVPGHWERQRQGQVWVDAHWSRRGGGWHLVPGHWARR